MTGERRRFPVGLYEQGTEPDARFSLANERTFLAWVRTSLALIAGGVALEALGLGLQPGFRLAAAILLILAGIASPIQAWFGWLTGERSLRLGRPLPSPALALPVAVVVIGVGVLVFFGVALA